MKNACENTEKELAILQEQKEKKIGHFCFSCSETLTWRHTSNRCKKFKKDIGTKPVSWKGLSY